MPGTHANQASKCADLPLTKFKYIETSSPVGSLSVSVSSLTNLSLKTKRGGKEEGGEGGVGGGGGV